MFEIRAVVPSKIGFASHQNAVPVIADLEITASGEETIENAVLTVTASPGFIEPKSWNIDRLSPNSTLRISDRVIKLDGSMLAALNESMLGEIKFTLLAAGNALAEADFSVE